MLFGGNSRVARRLVVASIIAGVLLLAVAVLPTAACSWAPLSLDEVVGETPLIFVAKVVDQPAERSYALEVAEVFRGSVPASVTFAHDPNSGVSSCEAELEVSATYLFGTEDLTSGLGVGNVWLQIEGQALSAFYVAPPAGGTAALYDMLRKLPDASMPVEVGGAGRPLLIQTGILLLIAAVALSALALSTHTRPKRR